MLEMLADWNITMENILGKRRIKLEKTEDERFLKTFYVKQFYVLVLQFYVKKVFYKKSVSKHNNVVIIGPLSTDSVKILKRYIDIFKKQLPLKHCSFPFK